MSTDAATSKIWGAVKGLVSWGVDPRVTQPLRGILALAVVLPVGGVLALAWVSLPALETLVNGRALVAARNLRLDFKNPGVGLTGWAVLDISNESPSNIRKVVLHLHTPFETVSSVTLVSPGRQRRIELDATEDYRFEQGDLRASISGADTLIPHHSVATLFVKGEAARGAQRRAFIHHLNCEPSCLVPPRGAGVEWAYSIVSLPIVTLLAAIAWIFTVKTLQVAILVEARS